MKQRTKIEIRMAARAQTEAKLCMALAAARQAEKQADTGYRKRKDHETLRRFVSTAAQRLQGIRPEEEYRSRSYNLGRQVTDYIDHKFVKYRPPVFLYRSMLSDEGVEEVFGERRPRGKRHAEAASKDAAYMSWFLTVVQGGSFAKLTASTFTRKEAHCFLQAPSHLKIGQAIVWARLVAAGAAASAAQYLIGRFLTMEFERLGSRIGDLGRFYAASWSEFRPDEIDEITDYLRFATENREFSFKGRTLASVRKASIEWHRRAFVSGVHKYVSWSATFNVWETARKGLVVTATELTNNRELALEGTRQRHCVFGYTGMCVHGRSAIVSLRWFASKAHATLEHQELNRLTLEVSAAQNRIVQIRGRLNRLATVDEMELVRHWAGDHGLRI